MTIIYYLFLFLFLFASFILCCVILMQESKSSGLGTSFGGEAGESVFGSSTPLVLKKVTAYLAICFLGGAMVLSVWTHSMSQSRMKKNLPNEIIER